MSAAPSPESRTGWFTVAGTFFILLMGFGSAYSFGTFFAPLQDEFGASRAAVSAAFSASILLLFSVGPLSGTLADRWGPRLLVAGGTALVGLGLIGASVARELWHVQVAFADDIGGGVGLATYPRSAPYRNGSTADAASRPASPSPESAQARCLCRPSPPL